MVERLERAARAFRRDVGAAGSELGIAGEHSRLGPEAGRAVYLEDRRLGDRGREVSAHEWHVLGAFGLLTLALSIFNAKAALATVGVATAVIVVVNAGKINIL